MLQRSLDKGVLLWNYLDVIVDRWIILLSVFPYFLKSEKWKNQIHFLIQRNLFPITNTAIFGIEKYWDREISQILQYLGKNREFSKDSFQLMALSHVRSGRTCLSCRATTTCCVLLLFSAPRRSIKLTPVRVAPSELPLCQQRQTKKTFSKVQLRKLSQSTRSICTILRGPKNRPYFIISHNLPSSHITSYHIISY